jgi:hypothetical protein
MIRMLAQQRLQCLFHTNLAIADKALDFDRSIAKKFDLPTFSWYGDQHHNRIFALGRQRIMDVGVLKVLQKCCQFAKWLIAQL